jgi:hypothetical protein
MSLRARIATAASSTLRRGGVPGVLGAVTLALAAGCAAVQGETGSHEQEVQPIDRMLIGRASGYPADKTLHERTSAFESSMAERRKAAWKIVEKVLEPVKIATEAAPAPASEPSSNEGPATAALELPRFQTWYSRDDILPMFDHLFRGLSPDEQLARAPFSVNAIDEVFPWNATMAMSLPSFTKERLEARKRELATAEGVASLGKGSRVLMSPSYVSHLLGSYGKIVDCNRAPRALGPAPGETGSFAPCLSGEFPVDAASIKARWMPSSSPIPTYDTSATALAAKLKGGTFGDGDGKASPDEKSIYTMRLNATATSKLVALHIMTKELKDWVWITLWWSPDPDSDFGADRPASLKGAFANYKMCVATAFSEKDPAPGKSFAYGQPSLAAALDVTAAEGPSTWCSNPYLETQEHAATTNCIGCHQHGGTGETADTVLEDPKRFPDFGRTKVRTSFPTDYGFTTDGGLDLASEFRARIEALAPLP